MNRRNVFKMAGVMLGLSPFMRALGSAPKIELPETGFFVFCYRSDSQAILLHTLLSQPCNGVREDIANHKVYCQWVDIDDPTFTKLLVTEQSSDLTKAILDTHGDDCSFATGDKWMPVNEPRRRAIAAILG